MRFRFVTPVLSTLVLLAGTVLLQATPLVPGGSVSPGVGVVPLGSPLLLDATTLTQGGLNEGFAWKFSVPGFVGPDGGSGNFINAVYKDPMTGTLDFFYQIQNTFAGSANPTNTLIDAFHLTNWANVGITDVKAFVGGSGNLFGDGGNVEFKGPAIDPVVTVSRSGGLGNDLSIGFVSTLAPGQNSAVLLVKTNATQFDLGSATLMWITDPPPCQVPSTPTNLSPCGVAITQTFSLGALEPVVPEPGFYGMLALGLAGLWMGVRRRSAKTNT
jgi:hypothetical protein